MNIVEIEKKEIKNGIYAVLFSLTSWRIRKPRYYACVAGKDSQLEQLMKDNPHWNLDWRFLTEQKARNRYKELCELKVEFSIKA